MGKVHLLGVGPGGRRSIDDRRLAIAESSDLLVGPEALLALFPRGDATRHVLKRHPERTLQKVLESRGEKNIVILAPGDPGLSGFADLVLGLLPPEEIVIHPAVDPVQIAFARLGVSWHDAVTVRPWQGAGAGSPGDSLENSREASGKEFKEDILRRIASREKVAVYTSEAWPPGRLRRLLREGGLTHLSAYVLDATGEGTLRTFDLTEADEREPEPIPQVLLLIDEQGRSAPATLDPLELDDPLFTPIEGALMSVEIRSETIRKMELTPESTVWVLGNEDGSLATEIGLLVSAGTVHAVEWEEDRLQRLVESMARFDQARVKLYDGEPFEIVGALPPPQAVYLSDRIGSIDELAAVCMERLAPGGRLVSNTLQYDRASRITGTIEGADTETEVSLINLSTPFPCVQNGEPRSASFIFSVRARRSASI